MTTYDPETLSPTAKPSYSRLLYSACCCCLIVSVIDDFLCVSTTTVSVMLSLFKPLRTQCHVMYPAQSLTFPIRQYRPTALPSVLPTADPSENPTPAPSMDPSYWWTKFRGIDVTKLGLSYLSGRRFSAVSHSA